MSNPLWYAHHLYLNDEEIKNIVIPNSVTFINDYVFSGFSGLKSITIPNSVTSIGEYAFFECDGLTSVTIPEGVTNIGNNSFNKCTNLEKVTLPNTLTSIGYSAFDDCYALAAIDIPSGVTFIDGAAFSDCRSLTSLIIPEGIPSIGECFCDNCTGLTSITIPNSVTSIGNWAFSGCSGLISINIGSNVTSIGEFAFQGCSDLTNITIPKSVTSISGGAFYNCGRLTFVKVENASPIGINDNTFNNRSNAVLQVPKRSIASYQAADYWKEFKKIIEDITEIKEGDVNVDEQVNVVDVVDIARFVVGTPASTFVKILADINKDNMVNLGDAVALVNDIAGDQNFVKAWAAPSTFTTDDALSLTERNGCLSMNLENERSYTAFQFDLFVPENADVTQMMLNAERKQGHQLLYNKVGDGHYRVAALSTSNRTFDGDNGELLNIALNEISGEEVSARNIHFFDIMGNDYLFEDIESAITTSVHQIDNEQLTIDNAIFDLLGRRQEKIQRGVNIVNGRKILF